MTVWRKSTRSEVNGACVELAEDAGQIRVRDSKNPGGPQLAVPRQAFTRLIAAIKETR